MSAVKLFHPGHFVVPTGPCRGRTLTSVPAAELVRIATNGSSELLKAMAIKEAAERGMIRRVPR